MKSHITHRFVTPIGVLVALISAGWSDLAHATPRMSLTSGTPCLACHTNPTGGGGRTELGWSSMSNVGAITYEDVGLSPDETNMLVDGLLSIGLDIRVQGARLGSPTIDEATNETVYPGMTFFPMQFQPYVTVTPADGLTIYGTYLPGPDSFKEDNGACDPVFAGMACYEGYVMYEPDTTWPTVRAGVFQPAIGIRHDDHTMLIRGDANDRRRPIIAPNYAEPGIEVITQPVTWFRVEAGGYQPAGLDDALNEGTKTADLAPMAYNLRVSFTPYIAIPIEVEAEDDGFGDFDDFGDEPETEDYIINSWFGASAYGSGDFLMVNGFMGLGIHEGVSFVAETSYSQRTIDYTTLNHLVGLWYTPIPWLSTAIRYEYATTTLANDRMAKTQALVAGLEFFPTPYMEVRPEYRLVETDAYRFGHATVQIHLFY